MAAVIGLASHHPVGGGEDPEATFSLNKRGQATRPLTNRFAAASTLNVTFHGSVELPVGSGRHRTHVASGTVVPAADRMLA